MEKVKSDDYPVPEAMAMAMALGREHSLVKMLAGIGVFGLIASLNGIIYSCSRQVYALSRAGFLPGTFNKLNRFQSPHAAVLFSFFFGLVALLSGKTSELIILSALGAVTMYVLSMASFFILRMKEPNLHRPFRTPFYPYFPAVALITSAMSLISMVFYNQKLAALFLGLLSSGILVYLTQKRWPKKLEEAQFKYVAQTDSKL